MTTRPLEQAEPCIVTDHQVNAAAPLCPACRSGGMLMFLDFGKMPAQIGIQWPSQEQARECQRGSMRLAFCDRCGFVSNMDYSPEVVDYAHAYDNDLSFSSVYQEFERDLVERLVRNHDLRAKRVLEIGCGHGKFLRRLCAAGGNRGIGFDPSHHHTGEPDSAVEFVADYYPDSDGPREADMIVCRQVFEHVPNPLEFLHRLRTTIPDSARPAVYFEVPSFDYVLNELALWTLIYEHCSYFTRESLSAVFARAGFEPLRAYDCFEGQFLGIEAVPAIRSSVEATQPPANGTAMAERVAMFTSRLDEKLSYWSRQIGQLAREGKRAVVWGAGARAVCFFNLVEGADELPFVVDINPNKIGKYVPGTGQEIVGPGFLPDYRPDVVIVMNGIYQEEIRSTIEALGLPVQLLCA